jgi:hypothetical protein
MLGLTTLFLHLLFDHCVVNCRSRPLIWDSDLRCWSIHFERQNRGSMLLGAVEEFLQLGRQVRHSLTQKW